ncbi:MAG: DUF115 domain-containing protein [Treponema sp.]|jgi:hypothetical protein|nr:DUF115 domain-containing protein [Treponema sp.]
MDKRFFFERNLLALSRTDPDLCSRLSLAETTLNRYKFLESRSGEIVPALVTPDGGARPLHSLVDPQKEGRRFITACEKEGFLIFLGLGGGFAAAAALEREDVYRVVVIDYDINGLAELFCSREYINILGDPRFRLLVDSPGEVITEYILKNYQPVFSGGIRMLPLRTRTEWDPAKFGLAGGAVEAALEAVSADYSVQAYFGTRWFSNIIRNIFRAEKPYRPVPPIRRAAVCAAGPSLDIQLPRLLERRKELFIFAVDTSLPSLLLRGLEPDAVVSIDCQHISYYHFMEGLPRGVFLFPDLASPPLVASRSEQPYFFSGGHPLARYISRYWRPLPQVDTAGANVTYAALSLADKLGAGEIELYGADFSYPLGRTYARGTYIYPYFENRQNRLTPLEGLVSAFLYRSPLSKQGEKGDTGHHENPWYYETRSLSRYRRGVEEKKFRAALLPVPGLGPPLVIRNNREPAPPGELPLFTAGRVSLEAGEFLDIYRNGIRALPLPRGGPAAYLEKLNTGEKEILATLIPEAAAIKRRRPELNTGELMEAVREYCLGEIDRVLHYQ